MSDGKRQIDPSRRNLLFGGFRRLLGEVAEKGPMARTSEALPVFREAESLWKAKDYTKASGKFKDCLKLEPGNADARRRLGCCLYRQGMLLQAKVEFERLLRADRADNESWLYLGLVFARGGKAEKAASVWKNFKDMSNVPLLREINLQCALIEQAVQAAAEEAQRLDAMRQAQAAEAEAEAHEAEDAEGAAGSALAEAEYVDDDAKEAEPVIDGAAVADAIEAVLESAAPQVALGRVTS